jgi:2-hydroxy-3-keto-5-methylthiopentenyl-1-phosphate phosphatase
VKIFCDFDGTVAVNDVGDRFFREFCLDVWTDAIEEWKHDRITTQECYNRECAATRTDPDSINRLVDKEPIDPTFPEFVCRFKALGIDVLVMSDGIDYYIRRILHNHGLDDLKVYANHLVFDGDRRIHLEFTWDDPSCTRCASCKGANMRRELANGERSVFVGDGLSDRCGADAADILFAKDDLVPYCESKGLKYHPFANFDDVANALFAMQLPELSQ